MLPDDRIKIHNASENNLKSISLEIPKNELVVVSGVSGSGKSSLVFDVIYRAAENRFFSSLSSHARQFLGKMRQPAVEKISGLSPAIAVDQRTVHSNPRSTVGTITGIHDYLRLLFARLGTPYRLMDGIKIDRSLFSFNSVKGACPVCKGLGIVDSLDPELFIADENRSLREGALVITAPNGYIIYSQVTLDVLDQVCRAEGFNIDIAWKNLTPDQKKVILYGSEKIEIPYGKHTLESRMKWSGITAKPRETGYYKGIIPVMETILKRERNKNILRFVRTRKCEVCNGTRLNDHALSILVGGYTIAQLSAIQIDRLAEVLQGISFQPNVEPVGKPIIEAIIKRLEPLTILGLGYLTPGRESGTFSNGEFQRLRLAAQTGNGLMGILYIFDEPSIGLHPRDTKKLLKIICQLRDDGNSVIVVEHDEEFIRAADWLIDIGPGAGTEGGQLILSSRIPFAGDAGASRTLSFLRGIEKISIPEKRRNGSGILEIHGATANNLKSIDATFKLEAFNVVTGVSGAGKSTLTNEILGKFLRRKLQGASESPGSHHSITNWESISKIIMIDQSPIGRTPRSNPATYTGLFDNIRDLFANQPESKQRGYDKGRFSFNTAGGRCESCQGAGYVEIGMHFMGNVEILCEKCEGKRFDDETLEIKFQEKNISAILEMTVEEAIRFFRDQPRIRQFLETLDALGLGYLTLGQRSSTLSGGEAQRVKLATELTKPMSLHTIYILDEPTTGLHQADVSRLLLALNSLVDKRNTVIVIEHHQGLIASADHVIDLGPEGGDQGGFLVASGTPEDIMNAKDSFTGQALKEYMESQQSAVGSRQSVSSIQHPASSIQYPASSIQHPASSIQHPVSSISFKGVTTNNLRGIDIDIPKNKITVLTGVSGSGKSSMAFDTLFAEAHNRFLESFSTYIRMQLGVKEKPDFDEVSGLTPTLAVDQRATGSNARSTAGTLTGVYDLFRLLYSRIGVSPRSTGAVLSSLFSFNHQHGACSECDGLGLITICDPHQLITDPEKSILNGAMDGTKTGKFYGDPHGQYIATLKTVGMKYGIDFSGPWNSLDEDTRKIALEGTGDEIHEITWEYKRDNRTGEHFFRGKWQGVANLVREEYIRKHADHRGESMMAIMKQVKCYACHGKRLNNNALSYTIAGKDISDLSALSISATLGFLWTLSSILTETDRQIAEPVITEILNRLKVIEKLGLPYISIDRPVATLSGGELQRIRLASQIGSGLTGMTYVLDEPTVGLHPADTRKLMDVIRLLQSSGNTVVIVEHDRDVIRHADHIIDLGPGAGVNGGMVLATGTPEEITRNPDSVTGNYLSGKAPLQASRNRVLQKGIEIKEADVNNLKGVNFSIPSSGIIVITGVSGSGKSSLVFDVLYESYERGIPAGCRHIAGFERFQRVIPVIQKSPFTSQSGTPVTYTGIFDRIRDLFAKTEEARRLNLSRNHFSFNSKDGRCEVCEGTGRISVSMDFMSEVETICEACQGTRYKEEVLSCTLKGQTISGILDMSFEEAASFFRDEKNLCSQFQLISQVGLGYLRLGQPLKTLSGGESQRLHLVTELFRPGKGSCLYLFEEPSTGLHFSDITFLARLFHQMADQGNTLVIIEHDPGIILQADWIIDLGPGGGDNGGLVVAAGRIQEIINCKDSLTGMHLKEYYSAGS